MMTELQKLQKWLAAKKRQYKKMLASTPAIPSVVTMPDMPSAVSPTIPSAVTMPAMQMPSLEDLLQMVAMPTEVSSMTAEEEMDVFLKELEVPSMPVDLDAMPTTSAAPISAMPIMSVPAVPALRTKRVVTIDLTRDEDGSSRKIPKLVVSRKRSRKTADLESVKFSQPPHPLQISEERRKKVLKMTEERERADVEHAALREATRLRQNVELRERLARDQERKIRASVTECYTMMERYLHQ